MFWKLEAKVYETTPKVLDNHSVRCSLNPSRRLLLLGLVLMLAAITGQSQTSGNSSLSGIVADPSGAVVPGATVEIHNPVSQFTRSTTTDNAGQFSFANVPFNPYHLSVTITGFAAYSQDIDVHFAVPQNLKIILQIASSAENVTVQAEATDLLENDPTFHSDVDRRYVRQTSAGELIVRAEFAGHSGVTGSRRRFQRAVPRVGRSRRKLVFSGWPADHGPAKQGLL